MIMPYNEQILICVRQFVYHEQEPEQGLVVLIRRRFFRVGMDPHRHSNYRGAHSTQSVIRRRRCCEQVHPILGLLRSVTGERTNMSYIYCAVASSVRPRDGMMGLGWPSATWPSPFIYTMYTLGVIPRRQFALKISNTASELYFGGANAALYSGSIYWNPIVTAVRVVFFMKLSVMLGIDRTLAVRMIGQSVWASVQVGTSQVVSTASHALIDSGTSVIYGPAAYVSAIFAAIPGSAPYGSKGGYTCTFGYLPMFGDSPTEAPVTSVDPCSADPGIAFTFNGKSWPFPASLLKYSTATGSSTLCYSNIKSWSSDYWILGDAWMKSVYAGVL